MSLEDVAPVAPVEAELGLGTGAAELLVTLVDAATDDEEETGLVDAATDDEEDEEDLGLVDVATDDEEDAGPVVSAELDWTGVPQLFRVFGTALETMVDEDVDETATTEVVSKIVEVTVDEGTTPGVDSALAGKEDELLDTRELPGR